MLCSSLALCFPIWSIHVEVSDHGSNTTTVLYMRLWMPHPWRHSRPGWMWLWAAWSGGWRPCPWGLKPDDIWGPFQPSPFYDSMIHSVILLYGLTFGLISLLKYTMFPLSTSWLCCLHSAALPHAIRQGTVLLVLLLSCCAHSWWCIWFGRLELK